MRGKAKSREGPDTLLQSFTKKYTDESTAEEFSFTFYCDLCDQSWASVPLPFSHQQPKSFWKKLFNLPSALWKAEHKDAFERANREGMFHFNRCPVCKRWVCDHHFSEEDNMCSCCRGDGAT